MLCFSTSPNSFPKCLGYFCNKKCCQELSKIAQSGLAVRRNLHLQRRYAKICVKCCVFRHEKFTQNRRPNGKKILLFKFYGSAIPISRLSFSFDVKLLFKVSASSDIYLPNLYASYITDGTYEQTTHLQYKLIYLLRVCRLA